MVASVVLYWGLSHSANRPEPPAHRVSFYLFNLLSKEACVRRNIDRPRCHTKTAEEISLNEAARLPMMAHPGAGRVHIVISTSAQARLPGGRIGMCLWVEKRPDEMFESCLL